MDHKLTVGQVAELVGVSVRTLHHYESLGLLAPERTHTGYRLYSAADVDVLHQILVYRSLEFPLTKIRALLEQGVSAQHLAEQHTLLTQKISHLQSVLDSVERMMEVNTMSPTPAQKAQAAHAQYADEAEARYGETEAYRQSAQRTAAFTDADWQEASAETDELEADAAQALREGVEPGSDTANAIAERHLASMNRYFDCSLTQQVLIARGYVADPRFTAHYDEREPGLARWLRDAIAANARRQGMDPDDAAWE